ncbi:MAG: endonuclease/exonuclease/phosphatase family protein [Leptolyngbya sp. SIO4C5]|nr:endonuclease/exonuclease/phosphatase family protein [Leptolyngbya sp. SIO4C5]
MAILSEGKESAFLTSQRANVNAIAEHFTKHRRAWAWGICLGLVDLTILALVSQQPLNLWWLEALVSLQTQYAGLAVLGVIAIALLRQRWPLLIALVCVGVLLAQLFPFYRPVAASARLEPLKVLVANVNIRNLSYDQAIALVEQEQPDLAVFIEVDDRWIEQLQVLTQSLPHSAAKPRSSALPYKIATAPDNPFGLAVYSRFPLQNPMIKPLGSSSKINILADWQVGDRPIHLVATHPPPPKNQRLFEQRNQQLAAIAQYAQEQADESIILLGDLNTPMWSPYFKQLIAATDLQNARWGQGVLLTWPTFLPPFLRIPIDHCLVTPDIQVLDAHVGRNIHSDHLPLVVTLSVS